MSLSLKESGNNSTKKLSRSTDLTCSSMPWEEVQFLKISLQVSALILGCMFMEPSKPSLFR